MFQSDEFTTYKMSYISGVLEITLMGDIYRIITHALYVI